MGLVNEVVRTEKLKQRLSLIVNKLTGKDVAALAVQKDIICK